MGSVALPDHVVHEPEAPGKGAVEEHPARGRLEDELLLGLGVLPRHLATAVCSDDPGKGRSLILACRATPPSSKALSTSKA
jgi:hypothetical protein